MNSAAQPPVGTPWHQATFGASFARFWRGYAVFRGRAARAEFWFWALWWFLFCLVVNAAFGVGMLMLFLNPAAVAEPPARVEQALEAFDPFPVWGYLFSIMPLVARMALGIFVALSLASLVPWIALGLRRLHDAGRSGWWVLLAVVPLGNAVLAVLLALPSMAAAQTGRRVRMRPTRKSGSGCW
jgi:uncharacterized membrane protein YhaH (DUF805 family)